MVYTDASRLIDNAYKRMSREIEYIRIKTKQKNGLWIFQTNKYTIEELLKSEHHQKIDSIAEKLGDDVKNWCERKRLSDIEREQYHNIRDRIDEELHKVNK
jgi:RNA polymerase-interacting CarD/CdnL/TRCF family regulator